MMKRRVGTIQLKPSGRYQAQVSSGRRVDGKPRRISKSFDTLSEAEKWVSDAAAELGRLPELGSGLTLRVLWVAYERDRRGKLANSTLDRYDGCFRRLWLPMYGDREVASMTVADVQKAMDTLHGRVEARQCKAALSSALTWAQRRGMITENVMRSAKLSLPGDSISGWEDEGDVWDDDPFGAIEGAREVWDVTTAVSVAERLRGHGLEPLVLAMVGAGLRLEESRALRRVDVRRVAIGTDAAGGKVEVTQVAVHHAVNAQDGRHRTKSRKSKRIVALLEPFGMRMWEIAEPITDKDAYLCDMSPQNMGKRWRTCFEEPPTSKHARRNGVYKGILHDIPYIPLAKLRNTHATMMQALGVSDDLNSAMHGNSTLVLYSNYNRPDTTAAVLRASDALGREVRRSME